MTTSTKAQIVRKMTSAERVLLMMPLNVVMGARIKGSVDASQLETVLEMLRQRHALLAVRVVFDKDGVAWYASDDVPAFTVNSIPRHADDQWLQAATQECKLSFEIETGPLVRFSLVHGAEQSELIVCGHHAICDGMSLTYLIRDILELLADSSREVEILPQPPAITHETVPSPPKSNPIAKAVIGLLNKKWLRQGIRFDSGNLEELHQVFWEKNKEIGVLAWELSSSDTTALAERCRAEGVTVNSALWTACLASQHEVQGDSEPYRLHAGLAVSVRDKLKVPVGEALGFFASSLPTRLEFDPTQSFWDAARVVHTLISDNLAKTDPFRSLSTESLAPTLLDSLYFSKYGLIKNSLSEKLVRKMDWHATSYGYAITNVGRVSIPTTYGQYELDAVYGPLVYSDVNEKTIGITTVGDKASFLMSFNEANVGRQTAEAIRDVAMKHLLNAVNG